MKKIVRTRFTRILSKEVIKTHHVRRRDSVKVLSGKFKNTISYVLKIVDNSFVYLSDIYKVKSSVNRLGVRVDYRIYNKIHISNVMNYDTVNNVASRIKHEYRDGKKVRVYIKTNEIVPDRHMTKSQRIQKQQQKHNNENTKQNSTEHSTNVQHDKDTDNNEKSDGK